jgi:signal transduction histidine kinase
MRAKWQTITTKQEFSTSTKKGIFRFRLRRNDFFKKLGRMRKCLYTFFRVVAVCLLVANAANAQKKYTDSLRKELNTTDWVKKGETLSALGQSYYQSSAYDSAEYYFLKADSLYKLHSSTQAIELAATNKADLANVHLVHNEYDTAIKWYIDAIKIMQKSTVADKWKTLGNLNAAVGTVYNDMKQYDKAVHYDLEALHAHQKDTHNLVLTTYARLYVAEDYTNLENFAAARKYLTESENEVAKTASPNLYQRLYDQWGRFYQHSGHLDSAAAYYLKALAYAKTGNKFTLMDNMRMLAFCYRDMKKYDESKKYLLSALELTRALKNKRLEAELLKNLGKVTAAQKDDEASVRYYSTFVQLSDSLNETEIQKRVNEIEGKYQSQQKHDSILLLQKNSQLQLADLHQKKALNRMLISGCLVLLLLLALAYRNFKNKNQLLHQSEELKSTRIAELEKERQLVAMQSVLKGQEEERSRLARDLHDGVGGLLSGVKLSLSAMKGNVFISQENAASVNRVIVQLDHSIGELRRVSHNMMPEALIKYGLLEALQNYCASLNVSDVLKVQLQAYGLEQRMEQNTEIVVYRIVQELLNNVIKHADAKNALVQLIREGDRFTLTVEDDGKGFDVAQIEQAKTAGFSNIRARAAYLGGSLDIHSIPGQGTSVNVEGNCL